MIAWQIWYKIAANDIALHKAFKIMPAVSRLSLFVAINTFRPVKILFSSTDKSLIELMVV